MEKRGQITKLLVVILAAVVMAIIAIVGMIYTSRPQGIYLAKNVMLSPYTINEMATRPKTKVLFDHVEFSHYDSASKQFRRIDVGMEKYAAFYKIVEKDRSLTKPIENAVHLFGGQEASKLIIEVQGKNRNLQQIDFISDFYRVGLLQDGASEEWAYFYHPGINQIVLKLFYD